ncbi:hypothetical protein [Facilibium subflavum]|uniref:hypothetical protein n=1 Tax=Facilibium subflavum TaxID=2219058 RepID=UPI0013C2C83A|nr:hypothetical protein [Facilibium subflavum]
MENKNNIFIACACLLIVSLIGIIVFAAYIDFTSDQAIQTLKLQQQKLLPVVPENGR